MVFGYTRHMSCTIFVHIIWGTYVRQPMIRVDELRFLERLLPSEARRNDCEIIAHGIVTDHVHLVLRLPGRFDVPRLVQQLKGVSSRVASMDNTLSTTGLRWAKGYRAKPICSTDLKAVIQYVRSQAKRHPDRVIPKISDHS